MHHVDGKDDNELTELPEAGKTLKDPKYGYCKDARTPVLEIGAIEHLDERKLPVPDFVNSIVVTPLPWQRYPKVLCRESRRLSIHRQYTVQFKHEPDLRDFPFDYPKLMMIFKLTNSNFKSCGLKVLPLEFENVPRLKEFYLYKPEVDESECQHSEPKAKVALVVKRKTGYYVRNGLVMLGLLTSLGFTSFMVRVSFNYFGSYKLEDTAGIILALVSALMTVPAVIRTFATLSRYADMCIFNVILIPRRYR